MRSSLAALLANPAIGLPGIRLANLVQQLGGHGIYQSVCQSDYTSALTQIGQLLQAIATPCITGAIDTTDTDATNPGVQPACTVTQNGTAMPLCHMLDPTTPASTTTPCVWFATDAACAATPTQLELHLVNATIPVALSCAAR